MENDNLKLLLERCLQTEIKSEKNINILSNKILEICNNDEKLSKTVVFQIITDLKKKKKLPDVLKELKDKKILWKHFDYADIIAEEEEQDNFIIQPFEIIEGITQCNKCGSNRVFSFTKQTRGGDESSTTFNECLKCKSKWSYSG
jgi:DNA-directed RNA polymerase subunit M/transcription elongation factor TFIIS